MKLFIHSMFKLVNLPLFILVLFTFSVQAEDKVNSFRVEEELTLGDLPTLHVDIEVSSQRDLHVVLKESKTWRNVKVVKKRIKKSGKYHFKVDVKELPLGNYRWDVFLTPRKKDWKGRIGKMLSQFMEIVVKPKQYNHKKKQSNFANEDALKKVTWPKTISNNDDYILTIEYLVKGPRDLHIKLLNSDNWEEHGAIKVKANNNGKVSLPFGSMLENFPAGKYAWVMSLTEVDKPKKVVTTRGKHFVLSSDSNK